MARTKEYLALKNFFHNTMGLSRAELKLVVRDVVEELVLDNFKRISETVYFRDWVDKALEGAMRNVAYNHRSEIADTILSQLLSSRLKYEEWERQKELEKLGGPRAEYPKDAHP